MNQRQILLSPRIDKRLCCLSSSRLSGEGLRGMRPMWLQNLRGRPRQCCSDIGLGVRLQLIFLLQIRQHDRLRLRARLMGRPAGIRHDCTFCHARLRPERVGKPRYPSRIIVDQLVGLSWSGERVLAGLWEKMSFRATRRNLRLLGSVLVPATYDHGAQVTSYECSLKAVALDAAELFGNLQDVILQ